MSLWSELKGTARLGTLVGQGERLPDPQCGYCGGICAEGAIAATHGEYCPTLRRYGLVYFIQQGVDGPIKIGFTQQVITRRFAQIRPSSPYPLRLLLSVAGTLQDEQGEHDRHHQHRLNGSEWFSPAPDLLARIVRLRNDPATADAKRRFRVRRLDRMVYAPMLGAEDGPLPSFDTAPIPRGLTDAQREVAMAKWRESVARDQRRMEEEMARLQVRVDALLAGLKRGDP